MNKTAKYVFAASMALAHTFASAGIFDGLFDKSKPRLQTYAATQDKPLVDHFYVLSPDGKEEGLNPDILKKTKRYELAAISQSSLTLRRKYLKESNMVDVANIMRAYTDSPLDDEIGQRYVQFASSRGNIVKMYRPNLGGSVNSLLKQNFYLQHDKNTREWLDLDNLLLEYNPNGRLISLMSRAHQAFVSFGVTSDQYTNIYFGPDVAQFVENRIGNRMLEDAFLRVVTDSPAKPVTQEQVVTQPAPAAVTPPVPVAAPVVASPAAAAPPNESPMSVVANRIKLLTELAKLKQSGAISDAEFDAEKKKILGN